MKILQCNINNSKGALDLLTQHVIELGIGVCAVSEPAFIPDSGQWFGSKDRRSAILWNPDCKVICCKKFVSDKFVIVSFCNIHMISCYFSPNLDLDEFIVFLEDMSAAIRMIGGSFIICGDFNAKSSLWGSATFNDRGYCLEDWAAEIDLRVLNIGTEPTCVRPQGMSIVDLTWATPDLVARIQHWRVRTDLQSLSDHLYISFSMDESESSARSLISEHYPRWKWELLEEDWFQAVSSWHGNDERRFNEYSIEERATWLARVLKETCNAAAPRVKNTPMRTQAYWWSEKIAEIRRDSIRARRKWKRSLRRSRRSENEEDNESSLIVLQREYARIKKILRAAIHEAKSNAWQELINSIETDPWGMPYRLVLKKLRRVKPSLLETVPHDAAISLVESLFPANEEAATSITMNRIRRQARSPNEDELEVTASEIEYVFRRRPSGNTAPGPDGIPARILKKIPMELLELIRQLFSSCLREGLFPKAWKIAKLVLIPKGGESADGRPKARPICLLNNIGKNFERIIMYRLREVMNNNAFAALSVRQFGFCEGKSTLDALQFLVTLVEEASNRREFAIAVSLDIRNAFNSMPWKVINEAMIRKRFPVYLCRIIAGYLSERYVEFPTERGISLMRMEAGVPQGSVLGPILWNIGYNSVLESSVQDEDNDDGCTVICFADDTLILATAPIIEQAIDRVNSRIGTVLGKIRGLGLTVATEKTEAVLFYLKGKHPRAKLSVKVGNSDIPLGKSMKYLGIMIDSRLNFKDHFDYISSKASKVAGALGRLMPNLRGPGENKRRLYYNVVSSVIMYGAPIWWKTLAKNKDSLAKLNRIWRMVAIRIIAGYRTISLDAACLLARVPPLIMIAELRGNTYLRMKELRNNNEVDERSVRGLKEEEIRLLRERWRTHLNRANVAGGRLVKAIQPKFEEWLDRSYGFLTYRLTQLLTGHGCFAAFLCRINKLESPSCLECDGLERDDEDHTLRTCEAWRVQRDALNEIIGPRLYIEDVINAMLDGEDKWRAVASFAETVIAKKEEAERQREGILNAARPSDTQGT